MSGPTPIPAEFRNAILAGLRQLQASLAAGNLNPDVADIFTDGGATPGLDAEGIDGLCEEINCSCFLYNPASEVPRIHPDLESPAVDAEMHLTGLEARASFNANRALANASEDELVELVVSDFYACDASDEIARYEAEWNSSPQQLFELLELLQNVGVATNGFECKLHEGDAMAWIKRHRPDAWARAMCEIEGVCLVQAEEPEIAGRWDWISDHTGDVSDMSFETRAEAARDAVQRLGLE